MVPLEADKRYYNRDGLLRYLRSKFGNKVNFRIAEVADACFTFQAPRNLTDVSLVPVCQAEEALLSASPQDEWMYAVKRPPRPVNVN